MDSMKDAAKFYIDKGFRPMPLYGIEDGCKHRQEDYDCKDQCIGKVPKSEHCYDRDYSEDDFNENTNLALIMGKQSDNRWFVGFDIDGELDLDEFLLLPETLECSTARGKHLIFEVPSDSPLGNWNDIFHTRSAMAGYRVGYKGAMDLKYCRGAMASPPSKTKNNGTYEWKKWMEPAMLPDSEINFLVRKRKFAYPHIDRYRRWSQEPTHKGKRP